MTTRVVAYIGAGLLCGGVLFLLLRTLVFRDSWRQNKKIDLKELRRIDIEYGRSKTILAIFQEHRRAEHSLDESLE